MFIEFLSSQLLLLGYGPIDCWYMVHCERETQVILSNREGIFVIHQSHQNTFSFVSIILYNLHYYNLLNMNYVFKNI